MFKKEWAKSLIKFLSALASAFLIVAAGTSESWLVIPATTIVTTVGGYFVSKKDLKTALVWAVIGLLAGIGFYAAI